MGAASDSVAMIKSAHSLPLAHCPGPSIHIPVISKGKTRNWKPIDFPLGLRVFSFEN